MIAADARNLTEAQWQAQVEELARLHGWRTYHTHDSRRSNPGFPDLVLVHASAKRTVFLELKKERGTVRPEQQSWIDDLKAAGQEAYIVRPSAFDFVADLLNTRRSHQ